MKEITFSSHAISRMSQRSIKHEWIADTLMYGKKLHVAGNIAFVMTRRALFDSLKLLYEPDREIGLTILAENSYDSIHIITAYKDRNSLKTFKKQVGSHGRN